ncbi:MAG TPA: tetratricopeptide repeat protein, partial [Polyangiaceae bacterium]|nr:tetratricopeptide repeat protein [Polyangiaceae bacterium]
MDLEQRVRQLEGYHDWQGVVEALEQAVLGADDATKKAEAHLRLGRILYAQFLQGVRALKHFQDAYKLNPAYVGALGEARSIYWELGKLNMVQKLLELQLKNTQDPDVRAQLSAELGDVLCDLGDYERARDAYTRALQAPGTAGVEERLADVQVSSGDGEARTSATLREANAATGSRAAALLLRAARLARRFAPAELESILAQAYAADPTNAHIAALYEGLLIEGQRPDVIWETQQATLKKTPAPAERALLAHRFGARWVLRHQNTELGSQLLEEALRSDPTREEPFTFLRDLYGTRGGDWERVIRLADELSDRGNLGQGGAHLLSLGGLAAWKERGDLILAKRFFQRLAQVEPQSPALAAFEAQIGEKLNGGTATTARSQELPIVIPSAVGAASAFAAAPAVAGRAAAASAFAAAPVASARVAAATATPLPVSTPTPVPVSTTTPIPTPIPSAARAPASSARLDTPQPSPAASRPPSVAPASARPYTAPPASGGSEDRAIADLREKLHQQESAKRYHEYVKTLLLLGDAISDPDERETLYARAAELYVSKFSNQAEAVKAYEKVLEVNPANGAAIAYLREMYEKRRDWEKLIQLNIREAETLDTSAARASKFKQIAALAMERVKKPEVCIDLWRVVLDNDPDDVDALNALSQLYDRARDYPNLADALQRLAELTDDTAQRVELLNKLGQVAGDRLKDEERAVDAYRMLLVLQPDDRRAQEQLKKRYVTLGRWDDLEVFYADTGKWDEFIRVLESNESRAVDNAQRIGMLMKIAELWVTQKGKLDRAARAYEKVLALDPENRDAAERLTPIYVNANNPKGLSSAIEVKLSHATDPDERLALLREVAALYETRLNEKAKAFERYLSAFALAPGDDRSQADVERAAQVTGRWEDVIQAYRAAIKRADADGDLAIANALRLRVGRALVEDGQRVDDALAEYRAVYESDPDNTIALAALERLYRQAQRWPDLLDVYVKKQELAESLQERRSILFEIARLQEEQLDDRQSAIQSYTAVLDDAPSDYAALAALDRLYSASGEWDQYADVLRRRIELESDERVLVDLKYRLAETQHQRLGDELGALENYREILVLDPQHEGARLALERMLRNKTLRGEAAQILEDIYESRGDWERLINALEILAQTAESSPRRVEIFRKIAATAAGQLGALDRGLEAQARALKEDPSQAETRTELEALAQRSNAWDALIAIYNDVATEVRDPELSREYWMRLASIEERLGKVDEAAASYERVLALDPADDEALAAMDALYRRTARWDQLIGVFRRRIELSQDGLQSEALYGQMAQVYEEKLRQPDDAILAYREVLALDPTSNVALAALDGLFTRQAMWEELAENLDTQLGLADTEAEQLSLMLRLAALREQQMGQLDAAIDGYRQVLERDPANTEALSALERLSHQDVNTFSIAEILEPLYRSQGDYQKLIGVYEVQVARANDTDRKVELLQQIASLYEESASDLTSAFDTMARALAVDPGNEATQESIHRLAAATRRDQDLARVFEELASEQREPELGSALYASAARIYEQQIGNVDRAVELYRKVLSIDPTNLGAAEALETLFQNAQRYADMSLILQRKADILEDVDAKKAALFQAATLEEDVLGRHEHAIGAYLKILEIDQEDLRSIDALIQLYLALSRWEELLSVYSKKAELLLDPEEKKLILYQVGAVHERELHDVTRAIDTYQRVLELDPDDLTALGRLDVLYQSAGNWQELLNVLQHEAELTEDSTEAVSYQYRIAELYERHLGDSDRAVELYRDILNVQPDHRPTLQALEGMKNGTQNPLAAAAVLEPVYESMGAWQQLISVLEVQVRYIDDAFAQVDLLHRIAQLYEDSLGDHRLAFDTYARAVSIDSQNEDSLGALERLAMLTGRWPAVAELYDAELDRLEEESDPARFVDLGLRVAQLYEVQLDDVEQAVARYRRVLAADPENQSAVRALDRLFTQTERWPDLAGILAREAEIGQTPDEILQFKYRLGLVYQQRIGDLDQAIRAYREVIGAAPEHAETLRALESLFESGTKQLEIGEILEPLYHGSSEWEKLIRVREAQLEHIRDPEQRIAMYHRIAEDAEERLLDPVLAFEVHVRAIKESPLDERVGEEIERLAAMLDGGWEQLANAYADVLSIEGMDAETQSVIGKRLARLFEEELADVAKAEETYRYVLTVVPHEADALANLDRIYSSLEQWEELAGVLEQRAVAAQDAHEKVELYTR